MTAISQDKKDVLLSIHVIPGASRSEWAGLHGERMKLRLAAPPAEGKANKALITMLADQLGISKNRVQLERGLTSRSKTIRLKNMLLQEVLERCHLPREDAT
jgi:uncharacterized protein (TIGR00251 family)